MYKNLTKTICSVLLAAPLSSLYGQFSDETAVPPMGAAAFNSKPTVDPNQARVTISGAVETPRRKIPKHPKTQIPRALKTHTSADLLESLTNLDLASCQAIARDRNRSLRTAQNNLYSAIAGGRIAEATIFAPTLDITHSFTEDDDQGEARAELNYLTPLGFELSPFISETSNSSLDQERSSNLGIVLKRRVFSAAERWRQRMPLTNAERALLQASNNLQQRMRELDFSVMRSFLAVQRVQNRLRVRRDRVKDAREFLTITEERVATDLAPKVDIVNATINLNQAEADVLNEETNLRSQTESLLNVLGLTVTNDLSIAAYDLSERSADGYDLNADSANLRLRHESLVNARLNIDFAAIEIRIQKDLLRPRFDLSLTAERRSEGADPLNTRTEDSEPFTVALSYSTALDFKKRDKARLRQLELSLENLESTFIDEEHRLVLELRAAHRNISRLETQVGLNTQRLEAERAKLTATLVRYEDGNVDNLEVTRAKQAVDDAEITLINTNIDLVLAEEEYSSLLPPEKPVQTKLSAP